MIKITTVTVNLKFISAITMDKSNICKTDATLDSLTSAPKITIRKNAVIDEHILIDLLGNTRNRSNAVDATSDESNISDLVVTELTQDKSKQEPKAAAYSSSSSASQSIIFIKPISINKMYVVSEDAETRKKFVEKNKYIDEIETFASMQEIYNKLDVIHLNYLNCEVSGAIRIDTYSTDLNNVADSVSFEIYGHDDLIRAMSALTIKSYDVANDNGSDAKEKNDFKSPRC